jgi:hypothetical protein
MEEIFEDLIDSTTILNDPEPAEDQDDFGQMTTSPLDGMQRSLTALQLSQKQEQQQPHHRSALGWRRHTDALITSVLVNAEILVASTVVSEVNSEALFNCCEQLLTHCLDDPGIGNESLEVRLDRASRLFLDPMVKFSQFVLLSFLSHKHCGVQKEGFLRLKSADKNNNASSGGKSGGRWNGRTLVPFSMNQVSKLRALALNVRDIADTLRKGHGSRGIGSGVACDGSNASEEIVSRVVENGAIVVPAPAADTSKACDGVFSETMAAGLSRLCSERFDELAAPPQRLEAIQQV